MIAPIAEIVEDAHEALLKVSHAVAPELETEKPVRVTPFEVYPDPDTSSVPTLEVEGVPVPGVPTLVLLASYVPDGEGLISRILYVSVSRWMPLRISFLYEVASALVIVLSF
jgi:hypothetical protein